MQSQAAAAVECPKCKAANVSQARFCHGCGNPIAPPVASARKMCPGCGKVNEGVAAFCYSCGVALPATVSAQAVGDPAGFWIRVAATILDGVFVGFIFRGIDRIFPGSLTPPTAADFSGMSREEKGIAILFALGILFTVMALIHALYATIWVGSMGRTPGKWILGLKIVRTDGSRVPYGLAFMRSIAFVLSSLPLGLGVIWIALTSMKRGWHDYLCDTRVIKLAK
jgi:uncharacterized RDD family membrane protein YckC